MELGIRCRNNNRIRRNGLGLANRCWKPVTQPIHLQAVLQDTACLRMTRFADLLDFQHKLSNLKGVSLFLLRFKHSHIGGRNLVSKLMKINGIYIRLTNTGTNIMACIDNIFKESFTMSDMNYVGYSMICLPHGQESFLDGVADCHPY